MPAEPDHFGLVGQQLLDRHYDRLGADPAPTDDATDGGVADPSCQRVDGLLFLGLEPLAQRFWLGRFHLAPV